MARTRADSLLLGEWACLGVLAQAPAVEDGRFLVPAILGEEP